MHKVREVQDFLTCHFMVCPFPYLGFTLGSNLSRSKPITKNKVKGIVLIAGPMMDCPEPRTSTQWTRANSAQNTVMAQWNAQLWS